MSIDDALLRSKAQHNVFYRANCRFASSTLDKTMARPSLKEIVEETVVCWVVLYDDCYSIVDSRSLQV